MIICSICTIPKRIDSLIQVLEYLKKQTIQPNKLCITICKYYPRLQEHYDDSNLELLRDYLNNYPIINIIIIMETDIGPCLKLLNPLKFIFNRSFENDNKGDVIQDCKDNFIYILDDDCCLISDKSIETLINGFHNFGEAVYGFMGVIEPPSEPIQFIHGEMINHDSYCSVNGIGGYRSVLYPLNVLKNFVDWVNPIIESHTNENIICVHSDQIFSYYCRFFKIEQRILSWKDLNIQYGLIANTSIFDDPNHIMSLQMTKKFLYNIYIKNRNVFPIEFCVDESLFRQLKTSKSKSKAFSEIIPNINRNYTFNSQDEYYTQYEKSYYAITKKKSGWDCMRHLEIILSGCIPYFEDLENCPDNILHFLPKKEILEAMNLPGLSYENMSINMKIFPISRYEILRKKIYEHCLEFLTCRSMSYYILQKVGICFNKTLPKILFLSQEIKPDYMRCQLLIGFKKLLGDHRVIDFNHIPHVYKNYNHDTSVLYGRGFSYTKILDPPLFHHTTEEILTQISNHYFDLIIYGSIHRGLPLYDTIIKHYKSNEIVYICGEDTHDISNCIFNIPNDSIIFIRELHQ